MSYRKCVGAVQPGKSTNVSRRGICDSTIWRKPLAFAPDAEGYKYMVWGFNGRFAILSPEPCQPPSLVEKESLDTAACYHWVQRKSCFRENSPPLKHAVASAAPIGLVQIRIALKMAGAGILSDAWFRQLTDSLESELSYIIAGRFLSAPLPTSIDPNAPVLKIAVMADGRITVDSKPSTIESLRISLKELAQLHSRSVSLERVLDQRLEKDLAGVDGCRVTRGHVFILEFQNAAES